MNRHEDVAAQGHVRGFREIAGPTRDTRTWEAKALECLYALGVLPPDDLAREDYRCAAQVYALLEVAESTRGLPHGPATGVDDVTAARIRAAEANTPMLRFRLHLQNASRLNPTSLSRKELRRMIDDPNFLGELEEALRDAR